MNNKTILVLIKKKPKIFISEGKKSKKFHSIKIKKSDWGQGDSCRVQNFYETLKNINGLKLHEKLPAWRMEWDQEEMLH